MHGVFAYHFPLKMSIVESTYTPNCKPGKRVARLAQRIARSSWTVCAIELEEISAYWWQAAVHRALKCNIWLVQDIDIDAGRALALGDAPALWGLLQERC